MQDSGLPQSAWPAPDPVATAKGAVGRRCRWAAGAAVALAALGGVFGSHASGGDVATWAIAVTTLLAFVAAAFVRLVTYQLLPTELRRQVSAARDRSARCP